MGEPGRAEREAVPPFATGFTTLGDEEPEPAEPLRVPPYGSCRTGADARRRSGGFTLLEIVLVVSLIAMLTALIAATVSSGLGGVRIRAASKELVAALRFTRSQAIVLRKSQALTLDVEKRRFRAPGRDWVELPAKMELLMETARDEQVSEGVARIRFFADGSSTGGNVELRRGESVWRIDIGWLTGKVTLVAPDAG